MPNPPSNKPEQPREDGPTLEELVAEGRCPECGTLQGIWHKLGCSRDPDARSAPVAEQPKVGSEGKRVWQGRDFRNGPSPSLKPSLQAELSHLTESPYPANEALAYIEYLEAEVERLREALRLIAEDGPGEPHADIAQAALHPEKETE